MFRLYVLRILRLLPKRFLTSLGRFSCRAMQSAFVNPIQGLTDVCLKRKSVDLEPTDFKKAKWNLEFFPGNVALTTADFLKSAGRTQKV